MGLGYSGQIFEKYLNIVFHGKSFHWEPSCSVRTDGWMNRQEERLDKATSSFPLFLNVPKNGCNKKRRSNKRRRAMEGLLTCRHLWGQKMLIRSSRSQI